MNSHEEATTLRSEIDELVRQAKVLLYGEGRAARPPKPGNARRMEREQQLEAALERNDWYRRDNRRLRKDIEVLEQQEVVLDGHEKDPVELQNLLSQRRKELLLLRKNGEGLDRIAEVQRRAEVEQKALRPSVNHRLQSGKSEIEQQKRLNVRLQADRLRLVTEQKHAEARARLFGQEFRQKEKLVLKSPGPAETDSVLRSLQREIKVLTEALRQDDKKFRGAMHEEDQSVEQIHEKVVRLEKNVKDRDFTVRCLQADLRDEGRPSDGMTIDDQNQTVQPGGRSGLSPLPVPSEKQADGLVTHSTPRSLGQFLKDPETAPSETSGDGDRKDPSSRCEVDQDPAHAPPETPDEGHRGVRCSRGTVVRESVPALQELAERRQATPERSGERDPGRTVARGDDQVAHLSPQDADKGETSDEQNSRSHSKADAESGSQCGTPRGDSVVRARCNPTSSRLDTLPSPRATEVQSVGVCGMSLGSMQQVTAKSIDVASGSRTGASQADALGTVDASMLSVTDSWHEVTLVTTDS